MDEACPARLHLALALGLFVLGALALAADPTIRGVSRTVPLLALGVFPVLVAGTTRMLLSGLGRREVAGPPSLALIPASLMAAGALVVWLAPATGGASGPGPAGAARGGALLWSAGMLAHAAIGLGTLRRPRRDAAPREDAALGAQWDPPEALLTGGLLYGLAATALVPAAAAGVLPWAAAHHAVLAGFVVLTILGVALQVLPRFTGAAWPPWTLRIAAPALAAPAFLALGISGNAAMLAAGAMLQAVALGGFALAGLGLLARAPRRRAPDAAYAVACVAALGGVGLGLGFVFSPDLRVFAPVHATLQLLGFVGLFALAASQDLYAPALRPGGAAFRVHTFAVTGLAAAGIGLAAAGLALGAPGLARAGFLAYAAALGLHLAGALAARRRAAPRQRVRPSPRSPSLPGTGLGGNHP
jgi:hypothetical protein